MSIFSASTAHNLTISFREDALGWEAENDYLMASVHEMEDEEEAWQKRMAEQDAYYEAMGEDDPLAEAEYADWREKQERMAA